MQQVLKCIGGLNLDGSDKYLLPIQYKFAKNWYTNTNRNTGSDIVTGDNAEVQTPAPSNTQFCTLDLPAGDNQCMGAYEFTELGQVFLLNWNSNDDHGIYRLNINEGTCDTVKVSSCFGFDLEKPIGEGNIFIRIAYNNTIQGTGGLFVYLIWTDGNVPQGFVDVTTAVATDGFNPTTYPYFQAFYPQCDLCEWLRLGTKPHWRCPVASIVPYDSADAGKPNYVLNKTYQWIIKYNYYDGRKPVYSPISTLTYIPKSNCSRSDASLPRCFDLNIYAGSWMVESVEVLFRNCNGNADALTNPTDWSLYDTVYKYDTSNPANIGVDFWLRTITFPGYVAPSAPCAANGNYFVYRFCGEKQCVPISVSETNRIYDDLGITSEAIAPAEDKLLTGGNKKYYDNLSVDTLQKIEFAVTPPAAGVVCPVDYVTISGFIIAHNPFVNRNQPIHLDDDVGIQAFGGIGDFGLFAAPYVATVATEYNQSFKGDKGGWLVGLRGTGVGNFITRTRQYRLGIDGSSELWGVEDSTGDGNRGRIARSINNGYYYAQYYEFKVPKGYYILEVYDHNSDEATAIGTSTYVAAVTTGYGATSGVAYNGQNEIVVDATAGDVDVVQAYGYIIISDLTNPQGVLVKESTVYYGYLKESTTINAKVIIELAQVLPLGLGYSPGTTTGGTYSHFTDRNGFYFFAYTSVSGGQFEIHGFQGVSNFEIAGITTADLAVQNQAFRFDFTQNDLNNPNAEPYRDCAHMLLTGVATDCDGNPISGMVINLTNNQPVTTDATGTFTFLMHAKADIGIRGTSPVNNWVESLIISQNGVCILVGCDACTAFSTIIVLPEFNIFTCPIFTYTQNPATLIFRFLDSGLKGLHSGTEYQFAIAVGDWMWRPTFAMTDDSYKILTPLITDTAGVFAPSTITWQLNALLNLDIKFQYLSFLRSKARREWILEWAASKIEYIDANGVLTSSTSATYIRVTIDGLNNFNTINNFQTTTTYQFVPGDRFVAFDNGGTTSASLYTSAANNGWIDVQIRALEDGNKLIIDFDSRLTDLGIGAWFGIYRPQPCTDVTQYWEMCQVYVLIDGNIVDADGVQIPILTPQTITTFDTYFLFRGIPQKDINGTDITFTTYHPYEHDSPSDFWGKGCEDIGRLFVENKLAKQTTRRNEIAFSDTFLNNGIVNGYGTWRSENVRDYGDQGRGMIKFIHVERDVMIVICQYDFFTASINPKYVFVDGTGRLVANPEGFLSPANQKIGSKYGTERSSHVKVVSDMVFWLDLTNNCFILSNYSQAYDISKIDDKQGFSTGISGYLMEKINTITAYNQTQENTLYKWYPHVGYDPEKNDILLTFFRRIIENEESWINNEREVNYEAGETLAFNIDQKIWRTFVGFVPEFFCQSSTPLKGNLIVAMRKGQPYIHNDSAVTTFNTFFGTHTDQIIEPVCNAEVNKIKNFNAIDVESNTKYYVDRIITNVPNMLSEIPPVYFQKRQNKFHSEVLRNINSIGGLFRGLTIYGYFARIRFVRDNVVNDQVAVPDTAKQEAYSEMDNIIVKFTFSERSGK